MADLSVRVQTGGGRSVLGSEETAIPEGGKTLLQPSDFTYLGAFAWPVMPNSDERTTVDITTRYLNGQQRLYTLNTVGTGAGVWEMDGNVEIKMSNYVRPTLLSSTSLGKPADGYGYDKAVAIHWSEASQRLYWSAWGDYGSEAESTPTLGYATLTSPSGSNPSVMTSQGIWKLSAKVSEGGYGTRWHNTVVDLPSSWASTYTGGKTLGVVGGGIRSVFATGPISIGPAVMAISHINGTRDTGQVYQGALTRCVHHPWHATNAGVVTSPYPAVRGDTNYISYASDYVYTSFGSPTLNGGTGYWVNNDYQAAGMVWIETPTKHGYLSMVRMMDGGLETTVLASPTPSPTQFAVASVGDLVVGDGILVWNGVHRLDAAGVGNGVFSSTYLGIGPHTPCVSADLGVRSQGWGEAATITQIDGTTLTVTGLTAAPIVGGPVLAGEWYYNGTVNSTRSKNAWFCYDPAALGAGALGSTPDQTPWAWRYNWASPYWGGTEYTHDDGRRVDGCCYDPVSGRLYICLGDYNCVVYQVNQS